MTTQLPTDEDAIRAGGALLHTVEHSSDLIGFHRRYLAKLVANVGGLAISLVNVSILPRTLGPVSYGSFEFLSNFFQNASGSWDLGTSTAFFTKLSRRNNDSGLLRFYAGYALAVLALITIGMLMVAALGLGGMVWPGQPWEFIIFAAILGYLIWISELGRKIVDAFGLTVSGELVAIGLRALGALVIVGLLLMNWLTLTTTFLKEQVLAATIAAGFAWLAGRHWRATLRAAAVRTPAAVLGREFWLYCSPLVTYSLFAVVANLADRWILQAFAGSREQGFYGLAYRLSAVSLVFTVAMTQLLQREFSRAHGANDLTTLRRLFRRYVPGLYALTAYFAAFAFVQTGALVSLVGGEAYAAAVPATMVMTLYPIHQTYGQLSGSLLYATDQTALYRNIGMSFMTAGIVATWLIVAPSKLGGLAAGSVGLAVKVVTVQFLAVNTQLWFNVRHVGLSFSRFLAHQIGVVGLFLCLAWAAVWTAGQVPWSSIWAVVGSGVIYTLAVAVACLRVPAVMGLQRADVDRFLAAVRRLRDGRSG